MYGRFLLIILLSFYGWPPLGAQELVPNAEVALSIDEALFETVMSQRKIPKSLVMMSAKEMEKVKGRMQGLSSLDFFYIKDWNFSKSPQTSPEYQHSDSVNDAALLLKLPGDPRQKAYDLAWTHLKFPLLAKKKYRLHIRYRLLAAPDLDDKAISDFYPKVFLLTDNGQGQPNWDKPLLSYPLRIELNMARQEHKRKNILNQFQKEYGGKYEQNFARDPDYQLWRQNSFTLKAPRKEVQFIAIVFQSKSGDVALNRQVSLLVDKLSLRPVPIPKSEENAAQGGVGY